MDQIQVLKDTKNKLQTAVQLLNESLVPDIRDVEVYLSNNCPRFGLGRMEFTANQLCMLLDEITFNITIMEHLNNSKVL